MISFFILKTGLMSHSDHFTHSDNITLQDDVTINTWDIQLHNTHILEQIANLIADKHVTSYHCPLPAVAKTKAKPSFPFWRKELSQLPDTITRDAQYGLNHHICLCCSSFYLFCHHKFPVPPVFLQIVLVCKLCLKWLS